MSKAFLKVAGLFSDKFDEITDQKSADIVLVVGTEDLRAVYNANQHFYVLVLPGSRETATSQPDNVRLLNPIDLFDLEKKGTGGEMQKFYEQIAKVKADQGEKAVKEVLTREFPDIAVFRNHYLILVIDDTEENLLTARAVLAGHALVTANRLELALKAIAERKFDAVLTDMQMPPDKSFSALNLDHYGVTETVPYGFAVIFEATKRGMPVAVVTDASHHQDWVSAMFDHIHDATVNGQRVLFFNHIGKRWDKALKALLEG